MMKSIVLAMVILLFAASARATVIEIPLPQLLGYYQNTERTTTIVLPAPPSVIHGASFRVSGTTTLGQFICSAEDGGVQPMPMDLSATMHDDNPARLWYATEYFAMRAGGAFSWERPFVNTPYQTTTWSFLMDGVGDISLRGYDPLSYCNVGVSVSGIITEAVFIIDADFPVAVGPSTWGKIKALYR